MKRSIAILLTFLLLLGMEAFAGPRAAHAEITNSQPDESDKTALIDAVSKVKEAKSLRYDTGITMELAMKISAQGMNMEMPIRVNMTFGMDIQTDPYLVRGDLAMDMDMGLYGSQSQHTTLYATQDGERMIAYSSSDEGASWTAQENENLRALLPGEAFDLLLAHAQDIRRTGTDTFRDEQVAVYTCRMEGRFIDQVMTTTGMDGMLSQITGGDEAATDPSEISDIPVTFYIDSDGYIVYYTMDMTEAMKGMLAAAMQNLMGTTDMEGMEITVDIPLIRGECTLCDFDAVAPFAIPEAALNAPEA